MMAIMMIINYSNSYGIDDENQ